MAQDSTDLSTEELARVDEAIKREMKESMSTEDTENQGFFAEIKELVVGVMKDRKDPFIIELERLKNRKQESNISFEIDVPSGKLVIAENLNEAFPYDPQLRQKEMRFRLILEPENIEWYASNNCAWFHLSDNYLHAIINEDGRVSFDSFEGYEEEFDTEQEFRDFYDGQLNDGERFISRNYCGGHSLMCADYDEWVQRGGDPDSIDEVRSMEYGADRVVVDIPPGKYRVTSYVSNDNFWKQEDAPYFKKRVRFADMELIESY